MVIFEDVASLEAGLSVGVDFFAICAAITGSFSKIEDFNIFSTPTKINSIHKCRKINIYTYIIKFVEKKYIISLIYCINYTLRIFISILSFYQITL